MAPIKRHEAAIVLSTCVTSGDGKSVLVKPGSFTPMRWFLERASTGDHAAEPPSKRRKLDNEKLAATSCIGSQDSQIAIAQISVDLHFPETLNTEIPELDKLATDLDFCDGDVVDVELRSLDFVTNDQGSNNVYRLALAIRPKGPVLHIRFNGRTAQLSEELQQFLPVNTHSQGYIHERRPATSSCCTFTWRRGGLPTAVRFCALLYWQSGVPAFPAGLPTGRRNTYPDYNVLSQQFPDPLRVGVDQHRKWSPQDFYDAVHVPSRDIDWNDHFGEVLESTLYPFQRRSVAWMLRQEGIIYNRGQIIHRTFGERQSEELKFVTEHQDVYGQPCFVNHVQGLITRRPPSIAMPLSGGILAEEMGLGKTVELMALILLHPLTTSSEVSNVSVGADANTQPSKATLIISPSSILDQWKSELSKHAPSLRVHYYEGVPTGCAKSKKGSLTTKELSDNFDVVLTTYQVLRREVHFAEDPPERNMRHSRKFERKRSPLLQIEWWRIILDEAQMVESGVTAAARVACRLPRVHSWAVSGTPLKKDVADLQGLLLFLRYQPFCDNPRLWAHLIANHQHLFRHIFSQISLRHTKAQVREELHLPGQKRVVITMPFTAVEQQHYHALFTEMCEEIGVDRDGFPRIDPWDSKNSAVMDAMRTWLIRLRQTCLHPQVGARNRKALGRGRGPLRTVAEVLEIMIEQTESNLRIEERAVVTSEVLRAHILANNKEDLHRAKKALEIYQSAMAASEVFVLEARERLGDVQSLAASLNDSSSDTDPEDSTDNAYQLGKLRMNLRTALQLQHVCCFYAATSYFQIKDNTALTTPDTDRFRELEQQEVRLYESAKSLRREILKDTTHKAETLMRRIEDLQLQGSPIDMPNIRDLSSTSGIENRKIVEKSYALFDLVTEQSKVIAEWATKMAEYLVKHLVDEEEGDETTGDEYETSTKQQDELYVYFDVLKALLADLTTCVTGESAPLIDHEAKILVRDAKWYLNPEVEHDAGVHAPELLLKLMAKRNKLKERVQSVGSIRGLIQEARTLENSMEWQGGTRQDTERHLVRQHLGALQKIFASHTRALDNAEKVVDLFRSTQNQRIEFYRQLQELSDAVAPLKDELDEHLDVEALVAATLKRDQQAAVVQVLKTRSRFLLHLRENTTPEDCVICRSPISTGVITVCAHQYCKDCITLWWQQHHTCPVCKRRLALADFHDITYKPKEARAQEEAQYPAPPEDSPKALLREKAIYSGVDAKLLDEIKAIALPASYGTKIDTLGRHLRWIREHDPGAKSIVFSQYREFLDVLGTALSEFKLGYSRLGKPGSVEKFRHDPSIDCLLLDAKTDSSGLTLVNATHVFICEPLIHTAVELQAIARVHRIGQTRATTVWMYLINDTVEEAIYEISVARRLAHVHSRQQLMERKDKSRATTPGPGQLVREDMLDVANSAELQSAPLAKLLAADKGSGEMVGKDDLWRCLFGEAGRHGTALATGAALQTQVDGHLRAEAAEQRRNDTTMAI